MSQLMNGINWNLVINIGVPLLTLFLGRYLDRVLEKRPKLISYLGHVSAFSLQDEKNTQVFTHSIVLLNTGRKTANNIRIGHNYMPKFNIYPNVSHTVENVSGGGAEILIPKLVPKEQLTISYLYFPPVTWDKINLYTKSDEGLAKVINVIPTPLLPKWVINVLRILIFIGIVTILYLIVYGIKIIFFK
ncbi:MAG: hypothetical protein NTX01_00585 [Candidatus Omnitrophica bacterium]|nr:hypothetical protein [Candidatus Omnitrophota bacterium]